MKTRRLAKVAGALVAVALVGVLAAPNIATADVDPKVPPDSRLKPGETFTHTSTQTMLGSGELLYNPSQCRTHPAYSQTCDVFRVVFDRDMSPTALNFAFFSLEFEQRSLPPLVVGVAGLNPPPIDDLNIYVWDDVGHYLGEDSETNPADEGPGGNSFSTPERGGFTLKKGAYDIVVQALSGVNSGYTLRVTFSNEKFGSPFELVDDLFGPSGNGSAPPAAPEFTSEPFTPSLSEGIESSIRSMAPLAAVAPMTDRQIRNLGFGITEQFNGAPIDLSRGRSRDVVAVGKAPSAAALLLALIGLPLALAVAGAWWLRRRRVALIA